MTWADPRIAQNSVRPHPGALTNLLALKPWNLPVSRSSILAGRLEEAKKTSDILGVAWRFAGTSELTRSDVLTACCLSFSFVLFSPVARYRALVLRVLRWCRIRCDVRIGFSFFD